MITKKIAIGCDDAAVEMKNTLKQYLTELGFEVSDFGVEAGVSVHYPDIAYQLATSVRDGAQELGILCCGTGIGMAITANKVNGIRAAQAHDTYSAQRARKSNDAQIITLGARVVGIELAKEIVHAFVTSDFEAGRSGPKVERIRYYENLDKR
ncbi:ribose 5-phosphate isomerase B [Zobellella denitrificans]|uniref:Ribose 5-phosphate isomerase n=1 Tax=Zobellella denitrificans TaxID=347534 RepID=A0A231N218_9GAMM|nr:ribose 5-phosphate isomerase B [Zobellella denitrificans]ATG73817.1 ribose 5-phosphate isomerase [Zobellella denitrificans]OXS16553.1 ribose 5-phosphate isomerase B [Zobellella denitrificans]